MDISSAYNKIINTRWSFTNNFKVQFHGVNGGLFDFLPSHGELNIVNYNLDSLSAEEQNLFTAGRHVSILGAEEIHTCTMKIRDHDQLSIYKNFLLIWRQQIYKYFDEYKFDIVIIKEPDYPNETEKQVLQAKDCYIVNVGNLTLDNEQENQIFEFDVQIKSSNVSIDGFNQYDELTWTIPQPVKSDEN